MPDECRRTEEKFAAANRNPEHDDAGSDRSQPAESLGTRRERQLGPLPGFKSGLGFNGDRRGGEWGGQGPLSYAIRRSTGSPRPS